ncbi:hypothetical protein QFC19_001361 [Naganishia cerealis]|uniref:Uncharacterized protein n=1 Tax=Naganishia cerealis TaxID=610337 RepID=A0ACC2WJX3_9TREE|nr:hypothetical protein QFC19_001361 [Naganishia cerealis]
MNSVRIEEEEQEEQIEDIQPESLPGQDNEGYETLYESLCNTNATSPIDRALQHRHTDKVPAYALARLDSKEGPTHEVCIDTGSAISLIDSHYLKKNLPGIQVHAASTIMLKGVGNNQTHGWIYADIHFLNQEKGHTSIVGAFLVVTSLATKIIIGNDILAEEGAVINLNNRGQVIYIT